MKWKTKDGQIIDIKEMTETHIKNCISMLSRQLDNDPGFTCYDGDSDGAYWASKCEDNHNIEVRLNLNLAIGLFEKELKRRNL